MADNFDQKVVSECCGADVEQRNNDGDYCTSCLSECGVVRKETYEEKVLSETDNTD